MQYCNLTLHWNVNTVLTGYGTIHVNCPLCPLLAKRGNDRDPEWQAVPCGPSIFKAAPAHLGMNLEPVFDFRSSTDSRTRWETRTGSASQTSSPCRWRNGWPRFTGCNCPAASTPPLWGGFPPRSPTSTFHCKFHQKCFRSRCIKDFLLPCRSVITRDNIGNLLLPREHVTLYKGGRDRVRTPSRPGGDGVGGKW